jgi:hypothetical protein
MTTYQNRFTTVYFFFDRQDPITSQDATTVAASLLYQALLSAGLSNWPGTVARKLVTLFSQIAPLDICVLTDLLFLCAMEHAPLIVVLDGIDECCEHQTLGQLIRFLVAIQHETNVRAFVTSRNGVPIELRLVNCMRISIQAQETDLRLYVREKLRYVVLEQYLKEEIEETLSSKADGMYFPLSGFGSESCQVPPGSGAVGLYYKANQSYHDEESTSETSVRSRSTV